MLRWIFLNTFSIGNCIFRLSPGVEMRRTLSTTKRWEHYKKMYLSVLYLIIINMVSSCKILSVTSGFLAFLWKGIVYGRRGNKLDLFYPPIQNKFEFPPLVVFIYGGAWSTGHRSIYCLLARQMAEELNAAVACPDYCTYPKVIKVHCQIIFLILIIFLCNKCK